MSVRSGKWSRGGIRPDGAVLMGIAEEDVRRGKDGERYLLWAPNNDQSHPWSDTPGGLERLQHCRIALDAKLLSLRVEKLGEEYWGRSSDSAAEAL